VQTTLLGLAIAFIIALIGALVGPYFIDWNQFRPQFEAEASRVIGTRVRVEGALDARLLPAPSLRLRSVALGGPADAGKARAEKLDVEFSLGALMRGEWRATELTINGMTLDLGLDPQGKVDWPVPAGTSNLATLAIDRLNLTGRMTLHDAASQSTLELNDIAFAGDVRSLAGSIRGDGNFMLADIRYPFRVSSGQTPDGAGTRLHLTVDPGARGRSIDLDGVLSFADRAPRFDGAATLSGPVATGAGAKEAARWRLSAKLKADPATARLDQLEASYGPDDPGLKFTGVADIRLGASPLLHAVLSARQLDADKVLAADSGGGPGRLLGGLRSLVATIPPAPLAMQVEVSAEQIMLGGRPLQNVAVDLRGDSGRWAVERLEFRAPGSSRVQLGGEIAPAGPSGQFKGKLTFDSSDPDVFAGWLQGRSDLVARTQKPLRLTGNLEIAANRIAVADMQAEIDGGTVEGRAGISFSPAGGSRVDAALKADRLDLDAATALVRSLAGQPVEWPDEAQLSLDVGRVTVSGKELRPFATRVSYGPKMFSVDQLKIGQPSGVMMEGAASFDPVNATGKLSLELATPSVGQLTSLIAPIAPAPVIARLDAMAVRPGPARLNLSMGLDKNPDRADQATARAAVEIEAPQIKGTATALARPSIAAMRAGDLETLTHSEISVDTKLSSEQGRPLLGLLGLAGVLSPGDGPVEFEASATGSWRAPLQVKAKLSGTGLDAEAQGSAEPWASEPKTIVNLSLRRANLAPLLDRNPADPIAQNISLSSRLTFAGSKLTFDDLDGKVQGSRMRGRVALDLGDKKAVDGEVGVDTLDLAPVFALAIGAAGRDAGEPLGGGLLQGWRGRLAFQALRGVLPGGGELRPIGGVIKADGQSLTFEGLKGTIGGGEAIADIDAKQTPGGVAIDARLRLSGVDGDALRYRTLAMPAGRASMQMTLASQGRSASALAGAVSGNGSLTLEAARIPGLDSRAFDVAIRASDSGQAADDVKLRKIVEPVLAAGALRVASAQIPFSIRDGRLRIGATTLDAEGARLVVSGGYDIAADQTDIRATLASTSIGSATSRPEIQIFAAGPPDALDRTVDVAALSAWLAVRAIDRETRRLEAIERGETPPPALPASIPPPAMAQPPAEPSKALPELPASEVPLPGRDPRRIVPKPRVNAPTSPATPPAAPPLVTQQVAPLPPPIEIRPAPGPVARPKPRAPLVLTPPVQAAPRP
jgi:AsmA family/AsmA-like C-terminal region